MRTLGIDLSANPAKTAVCVIDWDPFTITLLPRPMTDDEIVDAIDHSDFAAIDVPLGWPDAFVEAIAAHHTHEPWPVADISPPTDRVQLRFRMTDMLIRADGAQPLSVSTDRIGVAAMRGALLQHLLVEAGVEVDRSGLTGRLCETYPAAVLRRWGFKHTGYKTKKNDVVRRELVDELVVRCGDRRKVLNDALVEGDDDDLDAVVCALVAREVADGRSNRPDDGQLGAAYREGWIHLPDDDLGDLISR